MFDRAERRSKVSIFVCSNRSCPEEVKLVMAKTHMGVGGFLLLSTLKLYFYSLDLVLLGWVSLNATDQCLDLFHCGIFLFKVDNHM